ncbi:hypothetical protein ACPPVW_18535 [Leifsonia sp. McL0607]|uniref:hypothetical protein n=1 Tax=Leifsonia sp. McL0607 TaxID=3415672 RepID=UPI003CE933CA
MATESEIDRFLSHVLKGPEPDDCWFWVGAIGDDGYGRFWIRRDGTQRAVRPHRYLYDRTVGPLTRADVLMHSCDVPLCVHVDADPALSHLAPGTHASNMRDRAQKGRTGNGATTTGMRGISRKALTARSRALRALLLEQGWQRDAIAAALADLIDHPRLF